MEKTKKNFKKKDILTIGHTMYNDNGYAAFVCSDESKLNDYEKLLYVIPLFGEGYYVLGGTRVNGSTTDVTFLTTLPYQIATNEMKKQL